MTADLDRADDDIFIQIPDGTCVVGFMSARRVKRWNRWIWDVRFRVIDASGLEPKLEPKTVAGVAMPPEACVGLGLPYFVNEPERDRGSLRSKYATDFRRIVGRLPPRDLRKVGPEFIYGGCTLEVRVATIETDSGGVKLPEGARYSHVSEIVRVVDGTPLYLQRPPPKGAA